MTVTNRRKNDVIIEKIDHKLDEVIDILRGKGQEIGLVAQVSINQNDIKEIKNKPKNVKNWVVAAAVIINTLVAAAALYQGVIK